MQDGVNTPIYLFCSSQIFSTLQVLFDSSCDAQELGVVPRLSMNVTQGPVALLLLLPLPTEGQFQNTRRHLTHR